MSTTSAPEASVPVELRYAIDSCELGALLVARGEGGVRAILLGDTTAALREDLARRSPGRRLIEDAQALKGSIAGVRRLIERPREAEPLRLELGGTAFQRRVWAALCEIPVGATATYLEIACAIGAPPAVRAVAQACAANPLAVAVPCHRVLRKDGRISGYRWGVERKRALLAREAAY